MEDNPGWRMEIDIDEHLTPDSKFVKISEYNEENDRYFFSDIIDGRINVACSIDQLDRLGRYVQKFISSLDDTPLPPQN